jgi:phospholipase C
MQRQDNGEALLVTTRVCIALAGVISMAGCSAGGSASVPPALFDSARGGAFVSSFGAAKSPIHHVVFIVQENRSFNNLFMGFPGALTARYGYDTSGKKIRLRGRDLATAWDVGHASDAFFAACDGQGTLPGTDCKMDGWNNEGASPSAPPYPEYSYVPEKQIAPYWTMAKAYVLADHMFASNLDGSFVAHQYIVAAYASHAVDFPGGPWGCEGGKSDKVLTLLKNRTDGPSIRTCFDNPTIASESDTAKRSWRFYSGAIGGDGGIWSSYQADKPIYNGPDWKTDVINPPAQFLTDVAAGTLADVTWITPTYETSDHPGIGTSQGPAWVASVVDAIGASKFWKSTAIFIMWDDWGGMFDPVQPVYEDYDGLGFRVPMIVVSPYAKQGSVTHVQYETASVLRFMEDNFGLTPLAKADTRANDPADDPTTFDYSQPPRAFKKIAGDEPASYWLRFERRERPMPKPARIIGDD